MRGGGRRGGRGFSRGGFQGRSGGVKKRPALPFRLQKELAAGDKSFTGTREFGRDQAFRKAKQSAERNVRQGSSQPSAGKGTQPRLAKPTRADSAIDELRLAKKRKRGAADQQGVVASAAPKTKFQELLGPSVASEEQLQQQIAAKLGLKSGKKLAQEDDNMSEFLTGADRVLTKPSLRKPGRAPMQAASATSSEGLLLSGTDSGASDASLLGDSEDSAGSEDLDSSASEGSPAAAEGSREDGSGSEDEASASSFSSDGSMRDSEEGGPARPSKPGLSGSGKYQPPAVRAAEAAAAAAAAGGASGSANTDERVARRVRGLLNRMGEGNLHQIAADMVDLARHEGRRPVLDAVTSELLQAASRGPRATEQFAAVAATLVAGLASQLGTAGVTASFLATAAEAVEAARLEDDSLACGNLAGLLSHIYLAGLTDCGLIFSLLDQFRARFGEQDISMLVATMKICGLQLRRQDPVAMKEFVVGVHARAAQAREAGQLSTRADMLLDLVVEVKNNRAVGSREGAQGQPLSPVQQRLLKQWGVGQVLLRGMTWSRLLDPDAHKGQWWETGAQQAVAMASLRRGDPAMLGNSLEGGQGDNGGVQEGLTALAASQRFSSPAARAAFCIIMGASDYQDAAERLQRAGLKGEAEREAVRVTMECCLQEISWNPYYQLLLIHLCQASRSHQVTAQFCLWDHWRLLRDADSASADPQHDPAEKLRRASHLARLGAALIASLALPPTALKAVDFTAAMGPHELLHWRLFFQHLLTQPRPGDKGNASSSKPTASAGNDLWQAFTRMASQPKLQANCTALRLWLRNHFSGWLKMRAARQTEPAGLAQAALLAPQSRVRQTEDADALSKLSILSKALMATP